VDRCQELVKAHRDKEAAAVCLTAFEATGDPEAGGAAARAHPGCQAVIGTQAHAGRRN
jgi:hypothetical protein